MKKFFKFPLIGLFLFSLILTACGPKETILKFVPEKGAVYQIDTSMDQEMTQTVGGASMTITQHFAYGYQWTVTDIDADGNATVDVVYNHIATSQTFGDQTLSYDSATDDAPPTQFAGMDAMLGQGFSMKISPRGEVLSIDGLDDMYQAVVDNTDLPKDQKAQLYQAMQDSYGETALEEQLSSLFVPFDEQPAEVGHAWHIDQQVNGLIPVSIATDYTITAMDKETATIDVQSSLNSDPQNKTTLAGYDVSYDLTGTQTGSFTVVLKNGISRDAQLEQHLEGNMSLTQGDATLTVPLVVDTTITYQMAQK